MANTVLPLSSDIYLEVDGKKVAVVQSYTTRATRTSREIEAFGENEPVATIAGANKYTLELSRLYATDEAISDGINFYDLNDFSLVICKPDKRINELKNICQIEHSRHRSTHNFIMNIIAALVAYCLAVGIPTQVLLQVVAMFLGAVSQGSVAFNDVDYFFKRSFY